MSTSRIYKKAYRNVAQNGAKKFYDKGFKIQTVKLGRKIGFIKATKELGVNVDTLCGWNKRTKEAALDLGSETQTPDTALSLTEEVQRLKQQNRNLSRGNVRLREKMNFG